MRFVVFAVCILSLMSSPLNAAETKRVALVIGNGAYDISPLTNPTNDANDLATVLKKLGFEVILEKNASKRTILESLDSFAAKLRNAEAGLFYYAGHGMQIRGQNYIIPVGTMVNRESDIEYEAVNTGRILRALEGSGCLVNIVILDACRNNPFKGKFRSSERGLAVVRASGGMFISYATSPGDVAADGDGRNGVFTKYLLNHIRTPGLTIEQVFKRIASDVYEQTGKQQIPWVSSSLMKEFFFIKGTSSYSKYSEGSIDKLAKKILHSRGSELEVLLTNTSLLDLERAYTYLYEDSQSLYNRMSGAEARSYIGKLKLIKIKIGMLDINAVHYLTFVGYNPASGSGMTYYDFTDSSGKRYSFEGMFAVKEGAEIEKGDTVKVYIGEGDSAIKMINLRGK